MNPPDERSGPGTADWAELLADVGDPWAAAAAFDHAPHLFVLMEGPELRLVAANRVTRQLVGRPLYGLPIRDAIPELAGQEVLEQFERAYATGVPCGGGGGPWHRSSATWPRRRSC